MQPQTPHNSEEFTSFIVEGTHTLATISVNDYGFLLSARMAQSYLIRALQVLDSKRGFDRATLNELGVLKAAAHELARDYAKFESFCANSDQFDSQKTKNRIEWISKFAVRLVSRGYRVRVSHHLAYRICDFHSRLCSLLRAV